ncbi:MAG TPA: nitroreductase [Polyangiaceae bacterium]|nr:nitroreductase [Polyangiaceae bacterium]
MELSTVVQQRRSVRGFLRDKPVPAELLREALELAQQAPSNCNVQPWRVFVASGVRRDQLSQELLNAAQQRGDFGRVTEAFAGEYRFLQVQCAVELYSKLGVARDDMAGRKAAFLRNFAFFDAPHVAFICMDKSFGIGVALDVGVYLQTLLLALWERGVASCAQAALKRYDDVTRGVLGIADELQILCGVSLGYEDTAHPANACRQLRQPISKNVTLIE